MVYDKNTSFGNNNYPKRFFLFSSKISMKAFTEAHHKTTVVSSVSRNFKQKVSLTVQGHLKFTAVFFLE